MSIFKTAYDTRATSGFVIKPVIDGVKEAIVTGDVNHTESGGLYIVESSTGLAAKVPAFAHPLLIEMDGKEDLVLDARMYGSWIALQKQFRVRNETEYKLLKLRGDLNKIWITESPTLLRDVSPMGTAIFASWVGENVGRRFALDPREQFDLTILAALHYQYLFIDTPTLNERDRNRIAGAIAKATRASAEDVFAVMDVVADEDFGDVFHFCRMAQQVTGSVRLKDFNVGILYGILGGTWFSPDRQEIVAVALEHPPTWLAILYAAYTERSFKNSGIAKIAERGNSQQGKDYVRSLLNLVSVVND